MLMISGSYPPRNAETLNSLPVVPPVVSPRPRDARSVRAALFRRLQDGGIGDAGRDRREPGFLPDSAPADGSGPDPVLGVGGGGPRRRAGRQGDRDPP